MKSRMLIVVWLVALCGFWVSGGRHDSLLAMRAKYHLVDTKPLENAPPLMAFTTVVLGGMRGIIADVLWLRLSYLQDEGAYLEVVQLSDWITKLEPRCTDIWGFHGWNMAYNISVMMPDPEDKWRWISSGVCLLRDEGILYNPGDPKLYVELGWIFLHKIGRDIDPDHAYYRKMWAEEMHALFDGPRPDYDALKEQPEQDRLLREKYRLYPEIMKEVEAKYRPLDWTLPESHAVYWAYLGKQRSKRKKTPSCDRMISQGLRLLAEGGWGGLKKGAQRQHPADRYSPGTGELKDEEGRATGVLTR